MPQIADTLLYIITYEFMYMYVSFSLVQWLEETFLPYLDAWEQSIGKVLRRERASLKPDALKL